MQDSTALVDPVGLSQLMIQRVLAAQLEASVSKEHLRRRRAALASMVPTLALGPWLTASIANLDTIVLVKTRLMQPVNVQQVTIAQAEA